MVNTYFVPKEANSNHLKIIAIIAMAIDHIAYGFVPEGTILGQIMHTIGRITMPIMCFSLAEGYHIFLTYFLLQGNCPYHLITQAIYILNFQLVLFIHCL